MLGLNLAINKGPEETAATATQTRPVEADATRHTRDFKSSAVRANEVRVNDYRSTENGASEYRANALPSESSRFDDFGTDSFREQSFSGLNSYIEDEPKSGAGRVILLLLLLAALGVAGWWTFNNYRGVAQSRKAQSDSAKAVEAPPDSQSTPSVSSPAPAPAPAQTPAPTAAAKPPSDVPEGPSENASPAPDDNAAPANNDNATPATAPAHSAVPAHNAPAAKTVKPTPPPAPAKAAPQRVAPAPARKPAAATAKSSRVQAAPEPEDTGDASFRRAESYLYGRGAAQNCDEAIKNLKAASAKSNAKARSTFGTMYATGHCVPRDLPTSYLWFAMALRVDPNNQVLEKDLTAVWNQMTPPERQLATRMKQ
jgi:cytoskeletal protein RodZ